MNFDIFKSEPTEVEGLGTLTPLTMAQLVDLRFDLMRELIDNASYGLESDEKTKIAASLTVQVSEMSWSTQAFAVINSPLLLSTAASMMLSATDPKWKNRKAITAARELPTSSVGAIKTAVLQSFGLSIGETKSEATEEPDPPKAAGLDTSAET